MTNDVVEDLLLAGYVPLRSQGFALPCYASSPHSNAWYCAVCSTDGDHSGRIISFEPFEAEGIIRLEARSSRSVSVGDVWHDVLLWKEQVYVGTAAIIVAQLGGLTAELAAGAPLTLLDLAMATDDLDTVALAKNAYIHVQSQWGADQADHWQSDIFMRHQLIIEARRLAGAVGVSDAAAVIRELQIVRKEDSLIVKMPGRLSEIFREHDILQEFFERASKLSDRTGFALMPISAQHDYARSLETDAPQTSAGPPEPDNKPRFDERAARVLVIASGNRARQLLRYIRTPDWCPDWDRETRPGESLTLPDEMVHRPALDVIDDSMGLPELDQYDVVIWLADEEAFAGERGSMIIAQVERNPARGSAPLCILVPTLPAQMPAALLADTSRLADLSLFNTILDTSTARSPFWAGNPRRSIDRRIADLVSAVAQLLDAGSPLYAWLTTDRPRYEPLLLSVASGIRADRSQAALASEVSSAGLSLEHSKERDLARFFWGEIPMGRERTQRLQGQAIVRRHDPDFRNFVEAAVQRGAVGNRLTPDHRIVGEVPTSIAERLRYPQLSAAFRSESERSDAICVVTAEAPSPEALRAAARTGWSIMRFSDEEGLRSFGASRRKRIPPLPSDILLPELNRLGRNRGLAVRGVDPRDIIRIPEPIYDHWSQEFGSSELVAAVRWYRSSINRFRELGISPGVAAIPASLFLQAERQGDEAAHYLRHTDQVDTPTAGALAKRTADLRASWSEPAYGASRIMLEDGKLPVRLGPVAREEVAAQKFFTIDGDVTAALLFSSRLFYVWARATLTRSPSWSSRFSITRTFETFPLPEQFLVSNDGDGGRSSLRAPPSSRELKSLIERFDEYQLSFGDGRDHKESVSDYLRETEEVLLRMIGLTSGATDLDLLERLIEMNRTAGT